MKTAMIIQPMVGMTPDKIIQSRERAIENLTARGYKVIKNLFADEWYDSENMRKRGVKQIPLCFLAKSLENMSLCDAAYFAKGWKKAQGCRLKHAVAKAYGLEMLYEK